MSYAEIGEVLRIEGGQAAYVLRGEQKISLTPEMDLELNDVVHSEDSFLVVQIFPGTQVSFDKNTIIKLSEHMISETTDLERASSVIDFVKGIIRVLVTKDENQEIDQRIKTKSVSFGVRGTEFEISQNDNEDVDLDVFEGQVEASSPYVQSFVPEIIKKDEGLRFEFKQKKFAKRKFGPKLKKYAAFMNRDQVRQKWKAKRLKLQGKKRFPKKSGLRTHRPKKSK